MALETYGPGVYGPYYFAGTPGAGTNAVQTLTIGGTPNGGTFRLGFAGRTTAAITWSATNATLLANINAALDALPTSGTGWIVATAGTLTAGIGTVTLTFQAGDVAHRLVPVMTVADNSLTGTAPTLAIANTTPGVTATVRDAAPGAQLVDVTGKKAYVHTGTQGVPTWTVTGSQT